VSIILTRNIDSLYKLIYLLIVEIGYEGQGRWRGM